MYRKRNYAPQLSKKSNFLKTLFLFPKLLKAFIFSKCKYILVCIKGLGTNQMFSFIICIPERCTNYMQGCLLNSVPSS